MEMMQAAQATFLATLAIVVYRVACTPIRGLGEAREARQIGALSATSYAVAVVAILAHPLGYPLAAFLALGALRVALGMPL